MAARQRPAVALLAAPGLVFAPVVVPEPETVSVGPLMQSLFRPVVSSSPTCLVLSAERGSARQVSRPSQVLEDQEIDRTTYPEPDVAYEKNSVDQLYVPLELR